MPYLGNEVAPLVQALEGKELKLDSDGDSSITADTDDRVDVKVGGSDKLHVTSTGLGVGTSSPDGSLHVKGISDHGRIVLESGGTTGANNNMFMQFHNNGGTEIAQIAIEEGASNEGQLIFKTGGTTTAMTIDKDGHITKPLQPCFFINAGSHTENIAVGDTTVTFGSEVFDVGSNFASNIFTAPITGKYLLTCSLRIDNFDSGANYMAAKLKTSNREYTEILDKRQTNGDTEYNTMQVTAIADMDVNDTCFVELGQSGGTAQADVINDASITYFSGYLLA